MTIQKHLSLFLLSIAVGWNFTLAYGQNATQVVRTSSAQAVYPSFDSPFTGHSFAEDASAPYYSPDAPELANEWDKYNAARKESVEEAEKYRQIQQQFEAARNTVKDKIVASRLAELARLKPSKEPDISRLGFDVFRFPELDGSTSCDLLGKIVIARTLGIPFQWTGAMVQYNRQYGNQPVFQRTVPNNNNHYYYLEDASMQYRLLQVIPDPAKADFRQRNIFRDYFGQFQGTHESYLSLIGPPLNPDPNSPQYNNPPTIMMSQVMGPTGPTGQGTIQINDQFLPPSEIILVARKPSADELKAAIDAGVELDVRPIALDAFVFLVHRSNPVESLTLEEIRSIYANPNPTNWKDYGGSDRIITPFERNRNSGSRELMDEMVITREALEKYARGNAQASDSGLQTSGTMPVNAIPVIPPTQPEYSPFSLQPATPMTSSYSSYSSAGPTGIQSVFRDQRRTAEGGGGMMGPYISITQDPAGIAYSVYHYEHFMVNVFESRTLAVGGVMPNYETIRAKKYPLVSEVYVVTRKNIAADSPTAKLRDWLLSDDGQRTIRESGYVPINSKIAAE